MLFGDLGTLVTLIGLLSQYPKFVSSYSNDSLTSWDSHQHSWAEEIILVVQSAPSSMKCPPSCGICAYFMDVPNCATWISPHDMLCVQITVCALCGLMYLPKWTNNIWEDSPLKLGFLWSPIQVLLYAQIIPDHVWHCIDKCCARPKLSLGTHFGIPQTLRLTYLLTVGTTQERYVLKEFRRYNHGN